MEEMLNTLNSILLKILRMILYKSKEKSKKKSHLPWI